MLSMSSMGVPSSQPLVRIRRRVRRQIGCAVRKPASPRMLSPNSAARAASFSRFISLVTERRKFRTTASARSLRKPGRRMLRIRATSRNAAVSRLNVSSIFGRRILTATRSPVSLSIALCTCAMDAAATGGPKSSKSSCTGWRSCCSMVARASLSENEGRRSWSGRSILVRSLPTMSGRVARDWPNFT